MDIKILTEKELRQNVVLDLDTISAIETAFERLSLGEATIPPILRLEIPEYNGEVDVKTAYIDGVDNFALKASSGFFDNKKLGLPSLSGMMVVFDSETGFPEAVLLDNGYLTDVRTGAAGAVAAKHLSNEDLTTVGVIGAGAQGRFQVRALNLVRDFDRVLIYDRDEEAMEDYVEGMTGELTAEIVKASGAKDAVETSDLVITSTPSKEPYLRAEWLHPGLHITSMGSDAETKQELFPEVFKKVDGIFCDKRSQVIRLGEVHHAVEKGYLDEEGSDVTELGDVINGNRKGRTSPEDITVCDLTGVGVQDTAVANIAYEKAVRDDIGLTVQN